ncbi:MAG TPA: S8 family serine peptidase, partial [Candidatus Cloacimonadota bacterium]|nr:S8 family serine peptidase [Candidatus Cloacimonadota bacterium]
MKKYWVLVFVILVTILAAQDTSYKPGEIMLQLDPQYKTNDLTAALQDEFKDINLGFERCLSARMNIWLCTFQTGKWADEEVKNALQKDNRIWNVQFNHYISRREIPNDPSFDLQWNMHNTGQGTGTEDCDIDAPEAWDINHGGVTVLGDTLVIAIVDGGCDTDHEDLNLFTNNHEIPGNNIDDDNNGYIDDYYGWNAYTHSGNIPDDSHGTHVSGIAGACGNNNIGVTGVCQNAKIMPIDADSSVESIVVEGYGYVLEMRQLWNETNGEFGAFVISTNASFGVDYGNPANYPLW